MKFWIRLCALAIVLHGLAFAQRDFDSGKPCSEGQRRQFDFWVGNWDVSWPSSPHGPTGFGHDNVQKILANCVVQETFTADPLKAISVSSFIPETGQWKQAWMDNEGHYRDAVGESKNGEIVLRHETEVNGKKVLERVVWKNIKPMEFDWSLEKSDDGGQTWQVLWPIHYTKHRQ